MKIVFLDFDGVLNTLRYQRWLKSKNKPCRDEFGHLFCNQAVSNLEELIHQSNAKIVISSTWRLSGLHVMKDLFKVRGIEGEVIDKTPQLFANRGHEIEHWLFENDYVDRYVIIDDDTRMLDTQLPYFVQTNPENGFTKDCLIKAIKILS